MKRPILAIVIAILLAVAAGVAVFFYAAGAQQRAIADQSPVAILVSAGLIPAGVTLNDAAAQGLVIAQEVPAKLQPADSITAITPDNSGLQALSDIPSGQILFAGDFGTPQPVATGPIQVPDGMLAVSVNMQDPNKVGTFLRPGSEIAVFDTLTLPTTDPLAVPVSTTRPLLEKVTVLAIGPVSAAGVDAAGADAWANTLVTLAVDQTQAQKLIHGVQTGSLYMALLGDNATVTSSAGVSDADLFN